MGGSERKSKVKRKGTSSSEDEKKRKRSRNAESEERESRRSDSREKRKEKKSRSHKHSKRHSDKEKKSKDVHESKSHREDRHLRGNFEELSKEDYFSKNNEFATWLKDKKKVFFSDLSSESAHDLFSDFIKEWNDQKLESQYYEGIASGPRTSHNWKIKRASSSGKKVIVMDIDLVGIFTLCCKSRRYFKEHQERVRLTTEQFTPKQAVRLLPGVKFLYLQQAAVDAIIKNLVMDWGADYDIGQWNCIRSDLEHSGS